MGEERILKCSVKKEANQSFRPTAIKKNSKNASQAPPRKRTVILFVQRLIKKKEGGEGEEAHRNRLDEGITKGRSRDKRESPKSQRVKTSQNKQISSRRREKTYKESRRWNSQGGAGGPSGRVPKRRNVRKRTKGERQICGVTKKRRGGKRKKGN